MKCLEIIHYSLTVLYGVENDTGTSKSGDYKVVLSHSVLFDSTNIKPPACPGIKNSLDLSFRIVT